MFETIFTEDIKQFDKKINNNSDSLTKTEVFNSYNVEFQSLFTPQ